MFVCWFVCLLFIGHTTFVHFAALAPSGREQPSRRGPGGPARAGKRMHSESTRACRTTSQRKNRTLMPFKNKTVRARACCRITVCLLLECLLFVLNRTSSLVGADLGQLVYTYKEQCVFVGLLVCPLFIGHTRFPTLRRCLRVAESRRRRGRPRTSGQARTASESTRAHAVQLLNEKIVALMPFKNKTVRARMLSYT